MNSGLRKRHSRKSSSLISVWSISMATFGSPLGSNFDLNRSIRYDLTYYSSLAR